MNDFFNRRQFLNRAGVSVAAANFAFHLPSLGSETDAAGSPRKQRLVFIFSPNGVIPKHFWPDQEGAEFKLKRILEPLAPFQDRMITMHGVNNKIRGDGDGHMRGIGCLLTGIELFPGDVQGGSDTPAGWSKGISVDQFIKNQLQADASTQTRFGSLEFGVMVPDRADTWTRMSYAGPNQPVAPIDDPYQMFDKLYGQEKNRELLGSVLDGLLEDFRTIEGLVSKEDRALLREHLETVRDIEKKQVDFAGKLNSKSDSSGDDGQNVGHAVPKLPPNVDEQNENIPEITRMQMDLLVSAFAADLARVSTFQITNSVGQPKMTWLGIQDGHHKLSHEPDTNEEAYEKLIQINTWYCEQVAYLAKQLDAVPEPGGNGTLLDNTTIVWTNELGKGNSHTRNNLPFVMVGGGMGWQTGRALEFKGVPHNRLLMSFCEAMGYPQDSFGNAHFCSDGGLTGLS